ncbi:short-chain dehydrogenase [Agrobacterium tumefaciens]|jgi:NAD(P)-dependent dehydrogenase (short-subunit alcohol dehydrogenase family)|uniref:Dehydrogenase n=1 Tax=Agrobacterium fabrum (strain C58 / ATCC 33970) TaxID=176299 RepID=Q7D3F2_AGRFC|nr:SDR family oxidoreductase [Agrobacterium fabrum]KEY54355.1 short-chain dehydrogenase [Agrobacterium tumefaciens]AAK90666.2 dehydrogenase [Agrobacterium fabrum str. C58]KJX90396.1 oxidoreductase, short-chain dehydrogenase/reductase family [Agrobacterium tumefaciens]MCX2875487.1 SDR family oxidoreductase [Agrobacterium fabrum]NMV70609.1 SDR family oxidoreductase [Agrobacterium fabrum]
MTKWTEANIPNQRGRSAVVTGTGGLGLETALALARAGCDVTIAGRNPEKGSDAVSRIQRAAPHVTVSFEKLDLADLTSIALFAQRMENDRESLDLLVNNAGIMVPPKRQETRDGFELQFGTNYLGHFALTAHLMPLLKKGTDARVVTVSSVAARAGKINFADINSEKNYHPMRAYSQSKLACLMFALELQDRSRAAGWGVSSIAAHPGVSRTDLLHNAPGRNSLQGLARTFLWFLFQPVAQGALPQLFSATSKEVKSGGYYGPDRLGETRGHPQPARIPPEALDRVAGKQLWEISQRMTGL